MECQKLLLRHTLVGKQKLPTFHGRSKVNHTKLYSYQRMVLMMKALQGRMPKWTAGHAEIKDQMERAMISSILNLVEGNGRRTSKDRQCFFTRSTSSLCEVHACLDIIKIYKAEHQTEIDSLQHELEIIYRMVRRLP